MESKFEKFLRIAIVLHVVIAACWPTGVRAADWCVSTSQEMAGALSAAQTNQEEDTIRLTKGVYAGSFSYISAETHKLALLGGYAPGCSERNVDASNTVIDAGQTGPCLVVDCSVAGSFEMEGITFQNGETEDPHGAGVRLNSSGGDLAFSSNIVKGCHSDSWGDGAFISHLDTVNIGGCSFESNPGGGAYIEFCTQVTFDGNQVSDNESKGLGIWYATDATLTGNVFDGNEYGGFDVGNSCNIAITGNRITNNSDSSACRLTLWSGSSVFSKNTLTNNNARNDGGGVYVYFDEPDQTLTMDGNDFSGNSAGKLGGALYARFGNPEENQVLVLSNNIFAQNRTAQYCHGIYVEDPGELIMTNNNIVGNAQTMSPLPEDDLGGGLCLIMQEDACKAHLYNNIFWENDAVQCSDIYLVEDGNKNGTYTPAVIYNNDFDQGVGGFCANQEVILDTSNIDKQDPLFEDQDNRNYRLKEFSPCIDSGTYWENAPETDYDGIARPVGNDTDMGAYESVYGCASGHVTSGGLFYDDLASCLIQTEENATILCHAVALSGGAEFIRGIVVELKGGYVCDFATNSIDVYQTSIEGGMVIGAGTVMLEKIVLR